MSVNDGMSPEELASLAEDTRVSFPITGWAELEFLADDSVEEPNTLSDRVILAWKPLNGRAATADDVTCEDEEEEDEYACYCRGLTVDELLGVVQGAVPQGWTAEIVPIPDGRYSGSHINTIRQTA